MTIELQDVKDGDVLARDDQEYPEGAVQVTEVDGELVGYTLGGGFTLNLKGLLKDWPFHVATEEEKVLKYSLHTYEIEGIPHKFKGFGAGMHWNGWEMPMFDWAEAARLCGIMQFDWWYYHEKDDGFYTLSEQADEIDFWPAENIMLKDEGFEVRVYGIGTGCWCWDQCPECNCGATRHMREPGTHDRRCPLFDEDQDEVLDEPLEGRILRAVKVGENAFWSVMAESFPEAKTGDLDPLECVKLEERLVEVATMWVRANTDLLEENT
jgi:hypothetical protein